MIFDLGTTGLKFTRSDERKGLAHIKERLDKVVGNIEWWNRFLEAAFRCLQQEARIIPQFSSLVTRRDPNFLVLSDTIACGLEKKNVSKLFLIDGLELKTLI